MLGIALDEFFVIHLEPLNLLIAEPGFNRFDHRRGTAQVNVEWIGFERLAVEVIRNPAGFTFPVF